MKKLIVIGILLLAVFILAYIALVFQGANPILTALVMLALFIFIIKA